MKSVKYGTETFLTSDEVADALMAYAATLRGMDHGQLLTVPTIEENGVEGSISILIGPGIPMLSRPSVSEVAEPEAIALIEQMLHLTVLKTGTLRAEPGAAPAAEVHE